MSYSVENQRFVKVNKASLDGNYLNQAKINEKALQETIRKTIEKELEKQIKKYFK